MTEIMDNNTEQLQEQQSQEPKTTAEAEQAPAGKMFTQEEVNRIVGDRLERQRKQIESSINGRIANVEAREAEIQRYETEMLRKEIAAEYRIPEAMVDRIRGENRGEMSKDAAALAAALGTSAGYPPYQAEPFGIRLHGGTPTASYTDYTDSFGDAFAPGGDKHEPMQYLQRSDV